MNYTEQQAGQVIQQILQRLATSRKTAAPAAAPAALNIPVGVSSRHICLCREDMDILFGYGSTLTCSKALKWPGQYATEEMVTPRGLKGELDKVHVLEPLRNVTQVEISVADGFAPDTKASIRMSGGLLGLPGIEIIGPKRRVVKHNGVIVAWRHIHISPEEARLHGLHDGMEVDVQVNGPRGGVLSRVVVCVTAGAVLGLHIDMEKANGISLRNGGTIRGIK